ncbi:MYOZ1 protein, partial [Atractosteus spatula]|nr:MYOZ1 protein [Atractosteus spatula]
MPLSGTPAPNKRKKSSRIITEITQEVLEQTEPEESKLNLGKKISTPKDIMLEELSLLSNKGSKMFKMRQQRVEKFIYENNPDIFTADSMDNFQNLVPSLGGEIQSGRSMMDVGGYLVSGKIVGQTVGGKLQHPPVPPPKPGEHGKGAGAGGARGAGGAGGSGTGMAGTVQISEEHGVSGLGGAGQGQSKGKRSVTVVKTYISPWERAMKGNEELTATMKLSMPGPVTHQDLPEYKCFNRTAMPFGGYEKASKLMTFQLPEIDTAPEEPEPAVYQHDITARPSFNRTPIGWVCSGEPSHVTLELDTMPFDGETDDL